MSLKPSQDPFARNVYCIGGLPIDCIDMAGASARIRAAMRTRERLFLSTPNLNFLANSLSNPAFRASVLQSDLVVADGAPLVMLGRLLGAPLPERVAGSDLIERVAADLQAENALAKVFLFGGRSGVGARAHEKLKDAATGLRSVGFLNPGFGDVASMSKPSVIETINASGADFLLVALGAEKGQAWIMANRHALTIPVLAHLGAVIDFWAGSIARAPKGLQRSGFEWAWRIAQEPALWRRYWRDFWKIAPQLATHFLPWRRDRLEGLKELAPVALALETVGAGARLYGRGAIGAAALGQWRDLARRALPINGPVSIDLREISFVDLDIQAQILLLAAARAGRQATTQLANVSPALRRQLTHSGFWAAMHAAAL